MSFKKGPAGGPWPETRSGAGRPAETLYLVLAVHQNDFSPVINPNYKPRCSVIQSNMYIIKDKRVPVITTLGCNLSNRKRVLLPVFPFNGFSPLVDNIKGKAKALINLSRNPAIQMLNINFGRSHRKIAKMRLESRKLITINVALHDEIPRISIRTTDNVDINRSVKFFQRLYKIDVHVLFHHNLLLKSPSFRAHLVHRDRENISNQPLFRPSEDSGKMHGAGNSGDIEPFLHIRIISNSLVQLLNAIPISEELHAFPLSFREQF